MNYEQLLGQLAALRPRTAAALQEAHQRRQRHLRDLLAGARLAAVEELLDYLDAVAIAWKADPALTKLALLPARLVSDFETAVEASLSGYLAVAGDAMRDVMEVENLLWDFSLDATLAQQWLAADSKTLRRQFSADAVRKRLHPGGSGPLPSQRRGPRLPGPQRHPARHAGRPPQPDPLQGPRP